MLKTNTTKKPKTKKGIDVFISHSSKDVRVASLLIVILRLALNIPANSIRCTSVPGYKLPAGTLTDMQLRSEIASSKVFIWMVTPAANRSAYVQTEVGARWHSNQNLIPFIVSKSGTRLLKAPLKNMHALNGAKTEDVFQLVIELARELNIEPEAPSVYSDKIEELVKLIQPK